MENNEHKLVGAPGFEPGASCAQGRRATKNNCPVVNIPAETKQLSRDRSMWLAVLKCAHLSLGWAQNLAQSRWRHRCLPQFSLPLMLPVRRNSSRQRKHTRTDRASRLNLAWKTSCSERCRLY